MHKVSFSRQWMMNESSTQNLPLCFSHSTFTIGITHIFPHLKAPTKPYSYPVHHIWIHTASIYRCSWCLPCGLVFQIEKDKAIFLLVCAINMETRKPPECLNKHTQILYCCWCCFIRFISNTNSNAHKFRKMYEISTKMFLAPPITRRKSMFSNSPHLKRRREVKWESVWVWV